MEASDGRADVPRLHLHGIGGGRAMFRIGERLETEDAQPVQLKRFKIDGAYMKSLPKYITSYAEPCALDAYENRLSHLPQDVPLVKSIHELNLRRNLFKTIPMAILHMDRLRYLDLREQFHDSRGRPPEFAVPRWISQLHSLVDLRLPVIPRDHPRRFLSEEDAADVKQTLTPRGAILVTSPASGAVVKPEALQHLLFSVYDIDGTRRVVVYSTRADILMGLITESYSAVSPAHLTKRRSHSAR